MNNYIKSECYRIFRNKSSYLFIAVCSLLMLSCNTLLAVLKYSDKTFGYAKTGFSLAFLYTNMVMVFILCIMVAVMIFGNEYNHHTMKNSISYGINRGIIYFGKLLAETLYALAAFIIIVGVHVISAYLLLEDTGYQDFRMLLQTAFVCLPLFLFGVAVTNCFSFLIDGTGGAIAAACGVMMAFPQFCSILGMKFTAFRKLAGILPWNMINSIEFDVDQQILNIHNYWIYGLLQMLIFILIGYFLFQKKEIK